MTVFEAEALVQLTRIAEALEVLAAPEIDTPPGCPHPDEAREDFGETAGKPDWYCNPLKGGCGYRSVVHD